MSWLRTAMWVLALVTTQSLIIVSSATAEDANQPQQKIAIGKETTYITEPLRADGYPYYTAAIDQRTSQGVTPENNAAVLLMQALGPNALPEGIRKQALGILGFGELSEKGDYIVSQKEMIERWHRGEDSTQPETGHSIDQQFNEAQSRPWTNSEFSVIAQWLAINEKPLSVACRTADRPKFFFPTINNKTDDSNQASTLLPLLEGSATVSKLLVIRAMQRLGQNDVDAAWRDLQCCHRLARLVAQGPHLADLFVGQAMDGLAINGDVVLAHKGKLTAQQAMQMQRELQKLPPMPEATEKLDFCERCEPYLAMVSYVARDGHLSTLQFIYSMLASGGSGGSRPAPKQPDQLLDDVVDWNTALKTGNEHFDRLVKIGRISEPRERRQAMTAYGSELTTFSQDINKAGGFLAASKSKEDTGRNLGKAFSILLLPGIAPCFNNEDRFRLQSLMDETAFALAAYRAEKGQYPENLDALVPVYLKSVPDDTFAAKPTPIRYRREADAYLLWTVYANGIDDDGRGYNDDPPGDDFTIRPVPKRK